MIGRPCGGPTGERDERAGDRAAVPHAKGPRRRRRLRPPRRARDRAPVPVRLAVDGARRSRAAARPGRGRVGLVMGPRIGAVLTAFAVLLAVTIVGENAYTEPLVWIPMAVLVGIVGDRVRRGDDLRRALLGELRRGLVTVSREPQVGPYRIVSRYVPAEQAQVLAGDFYGVIR